MQIRIALATTLLLGLATLGTAHAQKDDSAREQAKMQFRAGEQSFDKGKYENAAASFEKAYEVLPLPAIAFSAAQAHRLQYVVDRNPSRIMRAVELYRLYVSQVKEGGRRADAIVFLSELEPKLDALKTEAGEEGIKTIDVTKGTRLGITTWRQDVVVKLTINGEDAGEPPVTKTVKGGTYTVEGTANGFFPFKQDVQVLDGAFKVVDIELSPRPGQVTVVTESGAEVFVDGRPVGSSSGAALEIPEGEHVISVTRRGREPWTKRVEVVRGEAMQVKAELETSVKRKAAFWTIVGSGGLFVASGVYAVLALSSDSKASDLQDELLDTGFSGPDQAEQLNRLIDKRNDRRNASLILSGVGAGVALISAGLYFFDTPTVERQPAFAPRPVTPDGTDGGMKPVGWAPVIGPDYAGLGIHGRF